MSRDHKKLRVFHDAHAVAIAIYRQTREFPRDESFGLRAQMRRAAVSVASNIVEGNARATTRDYPVGRAQRNSNRSIGAGGRSSAQRLVYLRTTRVRQEPSEFERWLDRLLVGKRKGA